MVHYACKNAHRDESEIYNYQRFNFRIINTLMGSWEVRLTWLVRNQRSYTWIFGWTLREDVQLPCAQTPELFFDLYVPFQLSAKEPKNYANVTGTRLTTAIHRRLLSRFFLSEGGRLYTGYLQLAILGVYDLATVNVSVFIEQRNCI